MSRQKFNQPYEKSEKILAVERRLGETLEEYYSKYLKCGLAEAIGANRAIFGDTIEEALERIADFEDKNLDELERRKKIDEETERKYKHLKDFNKLEAELSAIREEIGKFPTMQTLTEMGRDDLVYAVGNYHDSMKSVKEKITGTTKKIKSRSYV